VALCRGVSLEQAGEESGQESPEVGEDLADVVPASAEDGEDGIAEQALEAASGGAALGFFM
jgi:hypothetical protein